MVRMSMPFKVRTVGPRIAKVTMQQAADNLRNAALATLAPVHDSRNVLCRDHRGVDWHGMKPVQKRKPLVGVDARCQPRFDPRLPSNLVRLQPLGAVLGAKTSDERWGVNGRFRCCAVENLRRFVERADAREVSDVLLKVESGRRPPRCRFHSDEATPGDRDCDSQSGAALHEAFAWFSRLGP
jgi:hypothetical protein